MNLAELSFPDREDIAGELARAGLFGVAAKRFARDVLIAATGRAQRPFSDDEYARIGHIYEDRVRWHQRRRA